MPVVMSSIDIAKLCGKQHRNVLVDIEKLDESYNRLGLSRVERVHYVHDDGKRRYRVYNLTKEQTLDLITGYDAETRVKVNRYWLNLEQASMIFSRRADIRLRYARKELLEKLELLDNAEQLLRKAETARREALHSLGNFAKFDQRMIARYGNAYPIQPKSVICRFEDMMTIEEIIEYLKAESDYVID